MKVFLHEFPPLLSILNMLLEILQVQLRENLFKTVNFAMMVSDSKIRDFLGSGRGNVFAGWPYKDQFPGAGISVLHFTFLGPGLAYLGVVQSWLEVLVFNLPIVDETVTEVVDECVDESEFS
jgi:hypothetical protein